MGIEGLEDSEIRRWKVEIWIEEKGMEGEPDLTQVQMNDLIEKACRVINKEYQDVKVTDFDACEDKEE